MNQTISRRHFLQLAAAATAASGSAGTARAQDMSHRDRIEAALARKPTDRVPFGFWQHFPNHDRSPRTLANLCVGLQEALDLDFIKFAPYGLYTTVDWGLVLKHRENEPPIVETRAIQSSDEWYRIRPIPPTEGEYLVLLESQRLAMQMKRPDVPLVQTVFNPITTAAKMVGNSTLVEHIRQHPEALSAALEVITETTVNFAKEVVARGADGLFFASQWTGVDQLTPEEYMNFVYPGDMAVLEAVKGASWFNMMHVHANARWDVLLDYPVQAFNFPNYGPNSLSLADAKAMTDKALVSGLPRGGVLQDGTIWNVQQLVNNAYQEVDKTGLILAPDEVVYLDLIPENVAALSQAVKDTAML